MQELERLQNRVRNAGATKAKELRALRNADGTAIYSDPEEQTRRQRIEANFQAVIAECRTAGEEEASEIAQERTVLAGRTRVRASDFSELDLPIACGYIAMLSDDIGGAPLAEAVSAIEAIIRQAGPSNHILQLAALRVSRQRADRLGDEPLDPMGRASFLEAVGALTSKVHPGLQSEQENLATLEGAVSRLGGDAAMAAHMNNRYQV